MCQIKYLLGGIKGRLDTAEEKLGGFAMPIKYLKIARELKANSLTELWDFSGQGESM